MTFSLTRLWLLETSRKPLAILQVSARVKVQAKNWAWNCFGWFITVYEKLFDLWASAWVTSETGRVAHIKTSCRLQGLDYESLLDLIGGSDMLPDYTHYPLGNYGNPGHFFFYPTTEIQRINKWNITNENYVASSTKTPCSWNEKNWWSVL